MSTDVKHHYQDEAVARSYDRQRFSGPVGRTFDALEKWALRRVLRGVLRGSPRPRVLDVPCGTGRITELLLGLGLEVVGGDISPAMMDVARLKCARFGDRAAFRRLDLDGLDLPDDSVDLVTCIRLFHHLGTERRGAILRELARVTRRHVVVNVSLSSPYYRLRRRLKRALGQGISRASSTWAEIGRESAAAGLVLIGHRHVLRYASEDLVLLLEKQGRGRGHDRV
jgi:ubiquinone/menaquinone biosynthesis C-methylase UbiE